MTHGCWSSQIRLCHGFTRVFPGDAPILANRKGSIVSVRYDSFTRMLQLIIHEHYPGREVHYSMRWPSFETIDMMLGFYEAPANFLFNPSASECHYASTYVCVGVSFSNPSRSCSNSNEHVSYQQSPARFLTILGFRPRIQRILLHSCSLSLGIPRELSIQTRIDRLELRAIKPLQIRVDVRE